MRDLEESYREERERSLEDLTQPVGGAGFEWHEETVFFGGGTAGTAISISTSIGMTVCYRLFISRGRPSFGLFMRRLHMSIPVLFGGAARTATATDTVTATATDSVGNQNHQRRLP